MRELRGKGWRVLGYFLWMLGAGVVLDSERRAAGALLLAGRRGAVRDRRVAVDAAACEETRRERAAALRIALSVAISAVFLGFARARRRLGRGAGRAARRQLPLGAADAAGDGLDAVSSAPSAGACSCRPSACRRCAPLVSATNIGFMANMVLPLRIGEVVRPVLLSRRARTCR